MNSMKYLITTIAIITSVLTIVFLVGKPKTAFLRDSLETIERAAYLVNQI